jgi:uroporphyrinogen decarboxylase
MMNTTRERLQAVLHYKPYDKLPIICMSFWRETLEKWHTEGHLTNDEMIEIRQLRDYQSSEGELTIAKKLGFDETFVNTIGRKGLGKPLIYPQFEEKKIRDPEGGHYIKINTEGVYVKCREGARSIEQEVDHSVKDRESWEKEYIPRLAWTEERFDPAEMSELKRTNETPARHRTLRCGSIIGKLRNYWGFVRFCELQFEEPELFDQCINDVGDACYTIVQKTLESGVKFDFAHYWEDIAYNHGPLIQPRVFKEKAGKHYRRISDLCAKYGIDIISVDCDGLVDDLVPVWLDNGVNTMFPIECGAWNYDFETMRKKFGKELRGVGNINKKAFGIDKKAVDHEIERAKRLVDLGGYVPMPDHHLPPDCEWDLVRYYCDQMKETFWK